MNYSGWAPRPRAFGDFYRRDILYGNAGPTGIRGEPKPRDGKERRAGPLSRVEEEEEEEEEEDEARRRRDERSRLTSQLVYCSIRVHG